MGGWLIVLTALAYVVGLFAIASYGDNLAKKAENRARPYIYSLSLAIYCTSWTFYGSVGIATERGFEFLGIYLGPALVFLFGHGLIRRIVRLSKSERITSVADFLASRYGKSFAVGSVATLIAITGTVPYIALQLKAIADSVELLANHHAAASFLPEGNYDELAIAVAGLLALFAILFGTRHTDATEHQDGLVLAVAVESLVKLAAFLILGISITFFLSESPIALFDAMQANSQVQSALNYETPASYWVMLTFLSGFAILALPRQFYVGIVENRSEQELNTASWVFPLYLVAINFFVIPIAFAGLIEVGGQSSADVYVLAIPLLKGDNLLALLALIGGLSAATAMVIVASVALSIMVSNDIVMPLLLKRTLSRHVAETDDWSRTILYVRRVAIIVIIISAYLYFHSMTDNVRLASIGLLSFAAIAQFAPAFLGGLVWRGANARGAVAGMISGFLVWTHALLLPTLAPGGIGYFPLWLFGIDTDAQRYLFGVPTDQLTYGVFWSLVVNTAFFVVGSLTRTATPRERIQAAIFVPRETAPLPSLRRLRTTVTVNELRETIARYLGVERTERSFQAYEQKENRKLANSETVDSATIRFAEQLLASAVGSSSARLILSILFQRVDMKSRNAYRLLDDATDALQQNRDLLQIALDQMEEGITVFDQDFGLTCWNRQFRTLFGLPDEYGEVGTPASRFLDHLIDRGDIKPADANAILDRMTAPHQTWEMRLAKSGRVIEIRSNPMPSGGVVATYADITARVQADLALKRVNESLEQRVAARTAELLQVNEELAQAQRLAEEANLGKTRFLAGAGHDILQPLNAARLYCSALIEKSRQKELQSTVRNIDSALDSVETILGAVLDISRLDTGAMKPNETVFRISDLFENIRTDFVPLARKKGLELHIVPSSLLLETDRNLFRRLTQNLVSNAIKYTRTGRILVGVRRRGDLCEIQVIDTGIGIPESKLGSVFSEFTRLDEGAREADGLGLGLSIVDRIARVLRLEIRIWSLPGKGTSFSVVTPVSRKQLAEISPIGGGGARSSSALAGLRVLCIDNDERILSGMALLLEGWGCSVQTTSGFEAFRASKRTAIPDIMVADYHLNNENGFDVIGRIRQSIGMDIPAVLLTADRSPEVKEIAEELEMPIIHKPVKPAILRAALTRFGKMPAAAE